MPFVAAASKLFPEWTWKAYDTSTGTYNVAGVPTIEIKTPDKRIITLVGTEEIGRWLPCELMQKSTPECITSIEPDPMTHSYFKR